MVVGESDPRGFRRLHRWLWRASEGIIERSGELVALAADVPGVGISTRPAIFSINSSCPKKSRWRRWGDPRCARCKGKTPDPLAVRTVDLTRVWGVVAVHLEVEQGTDVTHQPGLPIVSPFLPFRRVMMNVGHHAVGVYDNVMDVGNDYVDIHYKFGLRVSGQRRLSRGNKTRVKT